VSDQINDLVARYQAGITACQLADTFGIHRTTVSLILQRQGIPRRNQPLTQAQIAAAISLYDNGSPLSAVGATLGCQPSTVWLALRAAGVKLRPRNGWQHSDQGSGIPTEAGDVDNPGLRTRPSLNHESAHRYIERPSRSFAGTAVRDCG